MNLRPFEMERWQSNFENTVEYNLSESGVHPATLQDLGVAPEELFNLRLGYPQANGTEPLRTAAASLYPGATAKNILATNGGAEANFLTMLRLVEPGDEAVLVLPNYMQTYGLVEALGGKVVPVWLKQETGWIPDPAEVAAKVTAKTRFIGVCNPNNPTGSAFGQDIIGAIASAADKVGCWIVADEVYQGAELDGNRTPSFWGAYPKTLVTHSLSKAYGVPGLRLGWVLGPRDIINEMWGYKDYVSIAPGFLSDRIGRRVIEDREKLYARTRGLLNAGLPVLRTWLEARPGMFDWVPPKAAAIAMIRYKHKIPSDTLAERLRIEKSTLIVPGSQFQMEGYIRLGYGSEHSYLQAGLQRVAEMLDAIGAAQHA